MRLRCIISSVFEFRAFVTSSIERSRLPTFVKSGNNLRRADNNFAAAVRFSSERYRQFALFQHVYQAVVIVFGAMTRTHKTYYWRHNISAESSNRERWNSSFLVNVVQRRISWRADLLAQSASSAECNHYTVVIARFYRDVIARCIRVVYLIRAPFDYLTKFAWLIAPLAGDTRWASICFQSTKRRGLSSSLSLQYNDSLDEITLTYH